MTQEIKKEFQKIFRFVVKYNGSTINWKNSDIRRFLRWAWYYKKLFIVNDECKDGPKRIVAVGIAWRSSVPNPDFTNFSVDDTEWGEYLHVYRVIIHPEYKKQGALFVLLSMALWRFPQVYKVAWESHSRKNNKLIITDKEILLERLSKHGKRSETTRNT